MQGVVKVPVRLVGINNLCDTIPLLQHQMQAILLDEMLELNLCACARLVVRVKELESRVRGRH